MKAVSALPVIMAALVEALEIRKYVLALLTKLKCDPELLSREIRRVIPEEEDTMLTIGEQWREEGKLQGKADMLLRQLRKRFHSVPAAVEQRIRKTEPAVLDVWAEQIFDAKTLEEAIA